MRPSPLLAVLLTGCTSYPIMPWGSEPASFDGHPVTVVGRLVIGEIPSYSHFYLCATGHYTGVNAECLDLIAHGHSADQLRRIDPSCVTLSGGFLAYGPNIIATGYLRSEIGQVRVRRVAACDAP